MKAFRIGFCVIGAAAAAVGFGKVVRGLWSEGEKRHNARWEKELADFYEKPEPPRDPWDIPLEFVV